MEEGLLARHKRIFLESRAQAEQEVLSSLDQSARELDQEPISPLMAVKDKIGILEAKRDIAKTGLFAKTVATYLRNVRVSPVEQYE